MTLKVSIVGVTGYTGAELLRILLYHPHVDLGHLTSRRHENTPLDTLFPRLARPDSGLSVTDTAPEIVAKESDVTFLCLPHETAQDVAPALLGKTKLIDLSADFRLREPGDYARYYSSPHRYPALLEEGRFVYGLPEFYRNDIRRADAVANPGCYAQLIQLLLAPFKGGIARAQVNAVSGITGAGRKPADPALFPPASQDMYSYRINAHRHRPEILQSLDLREEQLDFVPTVGPYMRGIFATAFIEGGAPDLSVYKDCQFVRMREDVHLAHITGTNYTDLAFRGTENGRTIVQGAFDNLLKGAAGTAVQNMNLMCGLEESAGLTFATPLYP
jgi:N-acetyl-gamma-glutamyl-phosphate reductase